MHPALGRGLAIAAIAIGGAAAARVSPAAAQGEPPGRPDSTVRVTLRDGSVIYGRLLRRDADSVVVQGDAGRHAVATSSVVDIRNAGTAHAGTAGSPEYWLPNANATRMFFGPTGRTLPAGDGYFAVHDVVLASVGFGITDRVQFGAGTLVVPNTEFWAVFPKFAVIRRDDVNVAVGALYGGVRDARGGIAYAVGTLGSVDNSVTVGIGGGIAGEKMVGKPVYMVSGERRVSRRFALVTENYFGAGASGGLASGGVRLLGERLTLDFAFLNSTEDPVFPGIPYVDFVIRW
jgi:hypothetical protein